MDLRTKFSVANSVTDLQKVYGCVQILCKFYANFDGNLNACKLVCKPMANSIFARRQTIGKFDRQICNKFTGVQICANLDGNLHACKPICKFVANLSLANQIFARRQTIGKSGR